MERNKEHVVSAVSDRVFRVQAFSGSREKEARSLYAEWLVRYPSADVNLKEVTL